jgi:hypothetical protein
MALKPLLSFLIYLIKGITKIILLNCSKTPEIDIVVTAEENIWTGDECSDERVEKTA